MIINRRFIFALVLLWLATPMHTQARSHLRRPTLIPIKPLPHDLMEMTEMDLSAHFWNEACGGGVRIGITSTGVRR